MKSSIKKSLIIYLILSVIIYIFKPFIVNSLGKSDNEVYINQLELKNKLLIDAIDKFGATSPQEAVNLYCEGVKLRSGPLQYSVMCDELKVNLVLSTGGTGFSKRDITPEATKAIIEREAPGICEAIRYFSLQLTKRAMLSRAVSGIRNETLIVNLPGSPKACTEALDFVLDDIKHGIDILLGEVKECSRK